MFLYSINSIDLIVRSVLEVQDNVHLFIPTYKNRIAENCLKLTRARLWNKLPLDIPNSKSLNKIKYKTRKCITGIE